MYFTIKRTIFKTRYKCRDQLYLFVIINSVILWNFLQNIRAFSYDDEYDNVNQSKYLWYEILKIAFMETHFSWKWTKLKHQNMKIGFMKFNQHTNFWLDTFVKIIKNNDGDQHQQNTSRYKQTRSSKAHPLTAVPRRGKKIRLNFIFLWNEKIIDHINKLVYFFYKY